MNIEVHISFLITVFHFFRQILRSGIGGSYGYYIFNFLRSLPTVSIVAALFYISTNSTRGSILRGAPEWAGASPHLCGSWGCLVGAIMHAEDGHHLCGA